MTKSRIGCLVAILVALLCVSVLFNLLLATAKSKGLATSRIMANRAPEFDEQTIVNPTGSSADKIAVLSLRGLISSSIDGTLGESMVEDFKIALRQAVEDKNVKAIVLKMNSPGGEVTASDEIYAAVRDAREKKPIVVYMSSVAASGAYYVACGASWLVANETTITGSIGVIIETLKYKDLLGKVGLDVLVFKSGKFKDILNGARDMSPEEAEYVQALVMQTYSKFVGIVAKERDLPEDQLRAGIADGRIVSGKDALEAKLINQVGQIEDAYAKARELGHAPDAGVFRYEAGFHLGKLLRMLGRSGDAKVEVNLAENLIPKLESGRIYLLPGFYAP